MSKYTMTFKKDDIRIEFITTDKKVINNQMEKWVKSTSELVKNTNTIALDTKQEIEPADETEKVIKAKEIKKPVEEIKKKPKEVVKSEAPKSEKQEILKSEKPNFNDLIESKNVSSSIDFLVVAAYYLGEIENLERYSLKQLNNILIKNSSKPIDHSVIHDAVSKKIIEVVPDYTGMADVTEYKLTDEGENYFNDKL